VYFSSIYAATTATEENRLGERHRPFEWLLQLSRPRTTIPSATAAILGASTTSSSTTESSATTTAADPVAIQQPSATSTATAGSATTATAAGAEVDEQSGKERALILQCQTLDKPQSNIQQSHELLSIF
jgi:hypothetical protein